MKKYNYTTIYFKTTKVDNLNIFYREAGVGNPQTILMLHGFPSSSHMYRNLIKELASRYHVVAPDYPGFGMSSCPSPSEFSYNFDHLAEVMEKFTVRLNLSAFNLYMHDYGGPVGFRIAVKHPEWIQSLIIQNANVYEDGLGPDVQFIGQLEQSGDTEGLKKAVEFMLSQEGIKQQYTYGALNPEIISPDAYLMDHFFMERHGIKAIQSILFQNYSTNFPQYPLWQNYLRTYQPHALVLWGKNDKIFIAPGAEAYRKDLKEVEIHLLDGGHFVQEEQFELMAIQIDEFLTRKYAKQAY
ncbi:alpha/beta hydrolase [Xanthocytophaga agilis]|uniref:Alpha/beta hydrolase n=1 Tax=Xanthocytophaga agilis TaxID=3048010 RepID=A0AAE3UGC2_9BACT|nr:alpha/beta hydrolase [Xanthocytophaga agilis]MDJ1503116.1 alpha/beta hydrolase [Xanthocytophaga agilis]